MVLDLYPPPQLHTGILGPGNDVFTQLEKHLPSDIEAFKKEFHIKGGGPGGFLNGPTIKAVLENRGGRLERLSEVVSKHGPKFKLFIEHLENLGRLNEAVNRKVLDKTLIADIIEDIGRVFKKLQDQFDLSETMKIHVIRAHYMDFFESKQETLLSYTDEVCESMHSQIKYFEGGHRYLNNKKGSQSHSDMQHKSVVHLNSLNIGDV